jgi:hypothetical protein
LSGLSASDLNKARLLRSWLFGSICSIAAVTDSKFNALQISTDSLAKLRSETGIDFLLIGSSAPITGMFNFSHARMSLTLVDVRRGNVVWTKQCGNSIWNGVVSTKDEIERGATYLVGEFGATCGELVKGTPPVGGGR